MASVRRTGTAPELKLRYALFRAGLRYRLKRREKLPGSPDIIFVAARVAIFVDGCFWHGCPQHGSQPKTNTRFWSDKIGRNRARDARVDNELLELGWVVVRVWEHELSRDPTSIVKSIQKLIRRRVP